MQLRKNDFIDENKAFVLNDCQLGIVYRTDDNDVVTSTGTQLLYCAINFLIRFRYTIENKFFEIIKSIEDSAEFKSRAHANILHLIKNLEYLKDATRVNFAYTQTETKERHMYDILNEIPKATIPCKHYDNYDSNCHGNYKLKKTYHRYCFYLKYSREEYNNLKSIIIMNS